jgi:hypothetical protein
MWRAEERERDLKKSAGGWHLPYETLTVDVAGMES